MSLFVGEKSPHLCAVADRLEIPVHLYNPIIPVVNRLVGVRILPLMLFAHLAWRRQPEVPASLRDSAQVKLEIDHISKTQRRGITKGE
jgi:hypothetical protein